MRYLSAVHTDIGISKKINQDAFTLKVAKTPHYNICFAVMCDGMGGLKSGELASSFVVNAFSNWFEQELPNMLSNKLDFNEIKHQWNEIAVNQGKRIMQYGKSRGISLGTTLSAIMLIGKWYITIHVGDSRIYKISNTITQLTKDHTYVANEVDHKRMTLEQAKTDARKNVLLQCIGASNKIECEMKTGTFEEGEEFLLCSDGFRHEISEDEIYGTLAPEIMTSEVIMKKYLVELVNLNKKRNEKDNITAILIKSIY